MTTPRFRQPTRFVIHTYGHLAAAAERATEMAAQAGAEAFEAYHLSMMANVLWAFTLEAFLNHVGPQCVPRWSLLERKLSPKEKILLLEPELRLQVDWGQRPFQTAAELLDFRNALAHGRTETILAESPYASTDPFKPETYPTGKEFLVAEWQKACTAEVAERARQDVGAVCRLIHTAAGHGGDPFDDVRDEAFADFDAPAKPPNFEAMRARREARLRTQAKKSDQQGGS